MGTIMLRIIVAIAMSTAGAAAQTPVSYTEGGRALFTVDVPDFWSVRTGGPREIARSEDETSRPVPRVLALQPTVDRGVWMGFLSPPDVNDLAAAREYLRNLKRFLALDATATAPVKRRIGGRPAEVFAGNGRRDGREVNFTVAAIDLPGDRVAIAAAVLEAGVDPAFADVLNRVFASFRAIR